MTSRFQVRIHIFFFFFFLQNKLHKKIKTNTEYLIKIRMVLISNEMQKKKNKKNKKRKTAYLPIYNRLSI